jgi:hypothetical protein
MRFVSGQRRRSPVRAHAVRVRPLLEILESRALPSVDLGLTFNGIGFTGYYPPDTIAAAGYNFVVEAVNLTIRYYDKYTGAQLFSSTLQSFFAPLGGVQQGSDPVLLFDNQTGRFVVGMLDYNQTAKLSRFDFAVSNDDNPFDGWTLSRYDMNDGVGGFEFADYPRGGYSADAWVIGFNMFLNGSSFNHADTLSIDKATLAGYRQVVPGGASNFTLFPATMQDANPGDPALLVERGGSSSSILKVFQMTETGAPTLVANVAVPSYSTPPKAVQPGGTPNIDTIDDRIMSVSMIYGQLLVAHTVNSGGLARVRWYEIDTTLGTPYLFQGGEIDQGPGVYTYMPSIAMNYEGDIGLTFMESSASEYVSMYVTGQSVMDFGSGTLQTPALAFPGTSHYTLSRAGDFSSLSVDPVDGYTFWAANEFKGGSAWDTGIAGFGVSPQVFDRGGGRRPAVPAAARVPAKPALAVQDWAFAAVPQAGANELHAGSPWSATPAGFGGSSSAARFALAGADGFFSATQPKNAQPAALGLSQDGPKAAVDLWLSLAADHAWRWDADFLSNP